MSAHGLLAKVAATVVTGVVGVAAYDLLRRAAAKAPVHEAAVTAAEWGLRGVRKAEETAESTRLASPTSSRRHANASGKRPHRLRWPTQTTTTTTNRHQQ